VLASKRVELIVEKHHRRDAPEFKVYSLFRSPTVTIQDTECQGSCASMSGEEWTATTQLIFPYRGVYVRHVGHEQVVAEANQVLFFNAGEGYRVSHPVSGGDGSLTLVVDESLLRELTPSDHLHRSSGVRFRRLRLRIDARTQALVALLRHSLHRDVAGPLEAEILALTLVRRSLGPRSSHAAGASIGRQKLVDRAKLVISSDLAQRRTLAEIAAEVRVSPVYLTQVFQQVEGLPLYQYQLRLRLARALELFAVYDDLTTLALDLGFSSHSHFSAAFRQVYGTSPSQFKRSAFSR
jgi:AraC family transcriptional regulator